MTPASLCQRVTMQRWPRVQVRFQVSRARARTQRTVRVALTVRFNFGFNERVKWRRVVAVRATKVRMETVRSCNMWSVFGMGGFEGTRWTYKEEGPGNGKMLLVEMVNEEEDDDGDVERGDPLAQPDEVERERGVL